MDNAKRYVVCLICLIVMASCLCISARAEGEPVIAAKAAILIDADTGRVLFERNADERLQMASTTKIMTTLLTLESGGLDDYFVVDADAIKVEGSSMGLKEGKSVTKRILCYGMMLPSGNDAANASAVSVAGSIDAFVDLMNSRAKEMGLSDTHFVTPSGLDDNTSDHYSTARDMSFLARNALLNPDFRELCATRSVKLEYGDGGEIWLANTNRLLSSCEGVIGVKTGFTNKAGRCLVSACEREGVTLICVTLSDPNDWYDHTRLYDYGFSKIERADVEGLSLKIPCVGGTDDFALAESDGFEISLMKGELESLEKTVTLPRFVYLPADDGAIIGKVTYYLDGKEVKVCDLRLKIITDYEGHINGTEDTKNNQ